MLFTRQANILLLLQWGAIVGLLCIIFLEEMECEENLGEMKGGPILNFSFLRSRNAEKPHTKTLSQQRLHKSTVSAETVPSETLLGTG